MVIRPLKVSDVMTHGVVTISPDTSLSECAKLLIKRRIGSLILTDNNKIRGVLTKRDLVWVLTKKSVKDLSSIKAKDVASRKVKTIRPTMELTKAISRMKKSGYKRLPVVYKGKVVGILTTSDIIKVEPSLQQSVSDLMRIEEESAKLKRREALAEGSNHSMMEGVCEECGNHDFLYHVDGMMICEGCKDSM
ncbi:hypothetical protein COU61_02245 [Candidatus Pacearchaeota archaeon CG10_big_fil_rev_8_21_14_0_10_35_13]|nr:MAG: hypothetical protein COU61_02245 [Candidatus Pacearchaeota archaeon CG10_big_fil_rev_8_21_14_0_10_35_13]